MDEVEMVARIQGAASSYRSNLEGRRVLLIMNDSRPPLEVLFQAGQFMHLCGVSYPVRRAEDFLDMACSHSINSKYLTRKYGRYTEEKLKVLGLLMYLDSKASIVSMNPSLPGETKADCVAVNANAVMGFIRNQRHHFPDTVLNLERRWENPRMVIAAVKTERGSIEYTRITKKPKGLNPDQARIRTIIASLERYSGDGDVSAVLKQFENMLR